MASLLPYDYIALESLGVPVSEKMPCFQLIRYVDPQWKRYGYPHLTGDLRVILDPQFCERTGIHQDDAPSFILRLSRYVSSLEDKATSIISAQQAQRAPSPSQASAQSNSAIAGRVVQRSQGCGCRGR
jgi:hypothetical protein